MPHRLLIVDDNAPFLEAARRLLEGDGLHVVAVASTTADALALHRQLRPDVTLVDVNLGAESGVELARILVDPQTDRPGHVIMISTYPAQDVIDLVETLPGVAFLSKSRLSAAAIVDLMDAPG